ncbi:TPA: hypothetical protein RZD97_002481, partial [Mannheimia haemolytica]|nr:hypothetical protein [Mannheimia haemolytica]HEB5646732.1 hypothetical protein [Mannheimia haemolytica]
CLPAFALANETGESCSKIEDSAKRLECYDSVFVKKDTGKDEATDEKSNWEYEQKKDELRNATTYFAKIRSTNTIDFGFPYNSSSMNLMLRKDPKYGNDVIFSVHGQFNGCMIESCKITVKFDDGKLESYRMIGADGGSNDTLFIENAKAMKTFVDKLKKSKKLIVEASFYNYGKGQFTFDTQGLEWKHF